MHVTFDLAPAIWSREANALLSQKVATSIGQTLNVGSWQDLTLCTELGNDRKVPKNSPSLRLDSLMNKGQVLGHHFEWSNGRNVGDLARVEEVAARDGENIEPFAARTFA